VKESNPRIPEPYASKIMYYAQYDVLERLSKDKSWSFTEVRPDGIVSQIPFRPLSFWGFNAAIDSPVLFLLIML
jgi:hypothetical protein